ncbi:MAG: peptidoglycan-binding protein [Thiothrix sp.]|nr:peptidoglycan-binding protein [Thiothrix sp.]
MTDIMRVFDPTSVIRSLLALVPGIPLAGCLVTGTDSDPVAIASRVAGPDFSLTCMAEVLRPAVFTEQDKHVPVTDNVLELSKIPSTISHHDIRIQTEPARFAHEQVASEFVERTEKIRIMDERIELDVVPPVYRTATKQIKLSDPRTRWKPGCRAEGDGNAATCLETTPARYTSVTQTLVDVPARVVQTRIPAEYMEVQRLIRIKTGQGTGIIPARYRTIQVRRVSKPWQIRVSRQVPQTSRTFHLHLKQRPEQLLKMPALCTDRLQPGQLRHIQLKLQQAGYLSTITGTLDTLTLSALHRYQHDNQLAAGAFTRETLNHMALLDQ